MTELLILACVLLPTVALWDGYRRHLAERASFRQYEATLESLLASKMDQGAGEELKERLDAMRAEQRQLAEKVSTLSMRSVGMRR